VNRLSKRKLRLIHKGYKSLVDSDRSDFLIHLEEVLTTTCLQNARLDKIEFNNMDEELSIRQFLTVKFLGLGFKQSVLFGIGSKSKLIYPLPKEWRNSLEGQGVKVNYFISALLWRTYSLLFFGKGVLYGLKSVFFLFSQKLNLGSYVYFDSLSNDSNGHCVSSNAMDHNIVNWYLQWDDRVENLDTICHSINNLSNFKLGEIDVVGVDGLPSLKGLKLLQYLLFVIFSCLYAFLTIFSNPYRSFMLVEIIKARRASMADKNNMAQDYLFNNSSAVYKPLWTYIAENKGSRVLFYFYSVNDEGFKQGDQYESYNLLHLMSWSYYLTWDSYHTDFVKRTVQRDAKISEVGITWFSSNDMPVHIPLDSIAVFDVTPRKYMMYIMYAPSFEYRTYDIANRFLTDICLSVAKKRLSMLHKVKRINKSTSNRYVRRLKQLSKRDSYIGLNPSVDPTQVIRNSKACISIPFTSTALIAKLEGKPSIYYDPTGMIQKDDRAAHGIPVVVGPKELDIWISQLD